MKRFLWVMLASMPVSADEILMKDGSKIEWTALRDKGETYEVETVQGGKVVIRKSEVERIVPVQPKAAAVLAGATFTFDKKAKLETVDFVKLVNQKNAVSGAWSSDGKKIQTPVLPHARLAFPVGLPEEYDLHLMVQRDAGAGAFYLFLPAGDGARFMVSCDGTDGMEGGVDGVPATTYRQKLFVDTKAHAVAFHVRKNRFLFLFDGKKMIDWASPDYASIRVPEKIEIAQKGVVLGAYETSYSITQFVALYPVRR